MGREDWVGTSSRTNKHRRLEHLCGEHKADAVPSVHVGLGLDQISPFLGWGENAGFFAFGSPVGGRPRWHGKVVAGLDLSGGDFGGFFVFPQKPPMAFLDRDLSGFA